MDCKDVQEQLVFFLDGELAEEESESLRTHLDSCRVCSSEMGALEASIHLVRGLPRLEARKKLEAAVWARIESELERHGFARFLRPRILIPIGAAMALGLIILVTPARRLIFQERGTDDVSVSADFLVNYPIIENLETLQDLDVIEKLPKSGGSARGLERSWVS